MHKVNEAIFWFAAGMVTSWGVFMLVDALRAWG
jgi:hypothetical protein